MKTIGIIGAGQLGQMLGFAAAEIGLKCVFLDPSDSPPAASTGRVIQAAFDDLTALAELAKLCDVITYEFENVPVVAVRAIEAACPVFPPPPALECAQDRLREKQLFESLQIPIPGYRAIDNVKDLQQASHALGVPLVVKTRRLGYDGKNQEILRDASDAAKVIATLGGQDLIAEQFVFFEHELSAIGAKGIAGDTAAYALSRNTHRDGILRTSYACNDDLRHADLANRYVAQIFDRLDYVGVMTLELFVLNGRLLANEIAPRVHNSGHWSIEGARTSQFANHLRAIVGLPLGETATIGYPGMVNIIGTMPEDPGLFSGQDIVLHDYGKTPRPGRKLGHATVIASSAAQLKKRLCHLRDALPD